MTYNDKLSSAMLIDCFTLGLYSFVVAGQALESFGKPDKDSQVLPWLQNYPVLEQLSLLRKIWFNDNKFYRDLGKYAVKHKDSLDKQAKIEIDKIVEAPAEESTMGLLPDSEESAAALYFSMQNPTVGPEQVVAFLKAIFKPARTEY